LKPATCAGLDYQIRHMPAPSRVGARLLDIGCGNGAFLEVANRLGYASTGLEPDPAAAAAAAGRGLDVRCGALETLDLPEGAYEQITMSHVIEHLHDPIAGLAKAFRLLAPGGRIWIAQPNIEGAGLQRFQAFWRGLEVPRHLVLMPSKTLTLQLRKIGFRDVRLLRPMDEAAFYFGQSLAMSQGIDPYDPGGVIWTDELQAAANAVDRLAAALPERGESITIIATRPDV
jgi:2-polyprenyl-3-methyl-5-hydroxy-6-metoxy-1,4-benzoquinol methylase